MRHSTFALVLAVLAFGTQIAQAQPQVIVSPSQLTYGGTTTVTITAPPGYYWALVGSTRDAGLVHGGVAIGVGTDAAILAQGVVGPGGSVSMPFTPPIGPGIDTYYLAAAIALDPTFVPPIPSATVAVRTLGPYLNTPVFPHGLSVNASRLLGVGWPIDGADAAPKSYVDLAATALAPGTPQATSGIYPIINVEQRGSGDLLNLRTNSTTFAGYSGVNPNRTQFRVLPDGGFFAGGDYLSGVIPATGPGVRLMWYPKKGAFRAGKAVGTEWNDASIDDFTFAFGNQVTASDYGAVAFGDQVSVTSTVGFGVGSGVTVSGTAGMAVGASHVVSGFGGGAIGYSNRAQGQGSMALGYRVNACGDYTVALGYRASTSSTPSTVSPCGGTIHSGSFAFSDESSSTVYLPTTADNQFSMRFSGGYRMFTNVGMTTGVLLNAGASSFVVVSDRNAKFGFEHVDGNDVLRRLMTVPISSFYYKDGDGQRYIGPMAQDFHKAFSLGDDKTIRMNDLDGVALASIQALGRQVEGLTAENDELRRTLREVLERLQQLESSQR